MEVSFSEDEYSVILKACSSSERVATPSPLIFLLFIVTSTSFLSRTCRFFYPFHLFPWRFWGFSTLHPPNCPQIVGILSKPWHVRTWTLLPLYEYFSIFTPMVWIRGIPTTTTYKKVTTLVIKGNHYTICISKILTKTSLQSLKK